MSKKTPPVIRLEDYTPPDFRISTTCLTFDLNPTRTRILATLSLVRLQPNAPLVLDGEKLKLISLKLDGKELQKDKFFLEKDKLTISRVPDSFELETEVEIDPSSNKALDGLYQSGGILCTQNEAQGFRKITYFIDRPDVLSIYKTKIIADKKTYPVLLSNGNPLAKGDLPDGRHWIEWHDPFPKPCYLYALVAGDLGLIQDTYQTKSGRQIDCRIYCDKGQESRCEHAMDSLKRAMQWDEERFDLECDLDTYMIVAVDSFNMGAMENKGLNIFNSICVLADTETAN